MTILITSHSHLNNKRTWKEEFTDIDKASCFLFTCHCLTLFLLDIHDMLDSGCWLKPHLQAFLYPWLCKQGQCFREERELCCFDICNFSVLHIEPFQLAISHLNVRLGYMRCIIAWWVFTSISYAPPISLDCMSSTKKVVASGQRAENTKTKLEK